MQTQSQESRELELYSTNDGDLYSQQLVHIYRNLSKKYKKGTYDHSKAPNLFKYFTDRAAKKYCKEFGGTWHQIFTPEVRRETAQVLADYWYEELKLGNYVD